MVSLYSKDLKQMIISSLLLEKGYEGVPENQIWVIVSIKERYLFEGHDQSND